MKQRGMSRTVTLDPEAPVVVGGLGGSGTRVIAQILQALRYHIGHDLNEAGDNLSFTLLFKRPGWHGRHRDDRAEIDRMTTILTRTLIGGGRLRTPGNVARILGAALTMARTGHAPHRAGSGLWPITRAMRILGATPARPDACTGWGFKEPNTHIYLDDLARNFPRMRYIHTIRHGLDMAFSTNQQQLYNWGRTFGVPYPDHPDEMPRAALEYWIRANQRIRERAEAPDGRRMLIVNFDGLCASPKEGVRRILEFLGAPADPDTVAQLAQIPQKPASVGRHRQHAMDWVVPAHVQAVRDFGFEVDAEALTEAR